MKTIKTMLLAVVTILSTAATAQTTITGGEYWLDGAIAGRQSLTPGTTIDMAALTPGLHTITLRVKDSNGLWSNQTTRIFYYEPPVTPATATTIAKREFWLDGQIASRQAIGDVPAVIGISTLSAGLHTLTMRVQDDLGLWSNQRTRIFYYEPPVTPATATTIVKREFWLDGLIANRQTIDDVPAVIGISTLSAGLHTLTMRVQDDLGLWSNQRTRIFYVAPQPETAVATLTRYLYYMDDDAAHSVSGEISDDSGLLVIDLTELELDEGDHTLTWRVGDSKGVWSKTYTETFTVVNTAIRGIPTDLRQQRWYDLTGRQLDGVPTRPGLYIVNGRKVVIK